MTRSLLLTLCVLTIGALLFAIYQIDFDLADPRVQQGAIAATVVITGWLVAFVFREAGAIFDRAEQSRDLQTALRAEIFDYAEALTVDDPAAWRKQMRLDVLQAGSSGKTAFYPYFARISEPVIFDQLIKDVLLLPENTIDVVIQFYSTLSDLRLFIEELREEEFRKLNEERRLTAYLDLLSMQVTVVELGRMAVDQLDRSLRGIPEWMVGPDGKH